MHTVVKFKRGFAEDWAQKNPILRIGEPGYERDTRRFKVGDGISTWLELDYFLPNVGDVNEHVASSSPHPVYDDGPSLLLLYENAKV
jgi:hypothetical protein